MKRSALMRLFRREPKDTTIGGLLLKLGFITRDQLLDAIAAKLKASPEQLLGEVLISRGHITRSQLERILDLQREERGNRVDYAAETAKLAAQATARVENLHGQLTELEDVGRRIVDLAGRSGEPKDPESH